MTTIDAFVREPVRLTMPSGDQVPARPLSYRDQRCLEAAHPRPVPPVKKQPGGTLAPEEPDYRDSGYIDAFNTWSDEDAVIRAAIIVGMEPDGQAWSGVRDAPERARAWCLSAIGQLGEMVSIEWCEAVCKAVTSADLATLVKEKNRGNSGSPSPTTTG